MTHRGNTSHAIRGTIDMDKAPMKQYAGNYTDEGLAYCQEFGDLYTNNDLLTLKKEIVSTIQEIKDLYGIIEYHLVWGWPLDTDAHIHLMILLDQDKDRHELIDKLDELFPKGQKYIEVRYKK